VTAWPGTGDRTDPSAPAGPVDPPDFWQSTGVAIAEAAELVLQKVLVPVARAGTVGMSMYLVVFLFLVVQNRIDRRDPKLALAPTKRRTDPLFRERSEVSV
jgi:hypothetical protein